MAVDYNEIPALELHNMSHGSFCQDENPAHSTVRCRDRLIFSEFYSLDLHGLGYNFQIQRFIANISHEYTFFKGLELFTRNAVYYEIITDEHIADYIC